MNVKKIMCLIMTLFLISYYIPVYNALGENMDVSAPAAVLMEQGTGRLLFEKNIHEVRPAASVMKVMNLLIAVELLDSGKISEKDVVNISDRAATVEGSGIWLKSDEALPVEELMKAIAAVSANDASVALAEYISGSEGKFISVMNNRAKELGMNDTVFKDCIGSDEDGNCSSAHDIAVMSRELMSHKKAASYTSSWIDHVRGGQTQIVNTNKLIKTYQGCTGIKTGTTQKAGSCIAASAERNGMKLIAVVLGGGNTGDRFKDVASLLDFGFSGYTCVVPKSQDNMAKTVKVKNGMVPEVSILADIEGEFVVPKGKESSILYSMELDENVTAPFESGYKVGKIVCKLGNDILSEYDIITENGVEQIGFMPVLKKVMMEFLSL